MQVLSADVNKNLSRYGRGRITILYRLKQGVGLRVHAQIGGNCFIRIACGCWYKISFGFRVRSPIPF